MNALFAELLTIALTTAAVCAILHVERRAARRPGVEAAERVAAADVARWSASLRDTRGTTYPNARCVSW